MKKRGLLFAAVLAIGMGTISVPAWAEEAPDSTDGKIGGLLSSLFSEGGIAESINSLVGEAETLSEMLPENVNVGSVLQTVGGVLEEAGITANEGMQEIAGMITNEDGSVDWDKVGGSASDLLGLLAGGFMSGDAGWEYGDGESEQDMDALFAQIMLPYDKADEAMFAYVAERNAQFMDAGDAQVLSKKTGYIGDPEKDEFQALAEFTQVNYVIDGDQMNMVSAATDTLLLTLAKGEGYTYTVIDEKHAEDGEGYAASREALCEEVGIPVDDFDVSCMLGVYNDASALADYLNEHPGIATAEYQGKQMSAEELQALADDYSNDIMDSLFEDAEEEVTEAVTE